MHTTRVLFIILFLTMSEIYFDVPLASVLLAETEIEHRKPNCEWRLSDDNQEETITALAFSSDNSLLVAGTKDGKVLTLDASNGKTRSVFKFASGEVQAIAVWSSEKRIAACSSTGNLTEIDFAGEVVRRIPTFAEPPFVTAVSVNGRCLAAVSADGVFSAITPDGILPNQRRRLPKATRFSVRNDAKQILLVNDNRVSLRNVLTSEVLWIGEPGMEVGQIHGDRVSAVQFSGRESEIVVTISEIGGVFGSFAITRKVPSGEVLRVSAVGDETATSYLLASGMHVVSVDRAGICLWDMEKNKELVHFVGGHGRPSALVVSQDDRRVAAAFARGHVSVWKVLDKKD